MENILSLTNEYGKKFCSIFLKKCNILGMERTEYNAGRKEFTVVYKDSDGSICTAILPDAGTNDDGTCFFGNIKHFAMCYAEEKAGVHLRLANNGNLWWPVWYLSEEDYLRWKNFYDEMMQKYS